MSTTHTLRLGIGAITLAALAACGGGSSTSTGSTDTGGGTGGGGTTSSTSAFPTGVAVASPTAVNNSSSVVTTSSVSPATFVADWAVAMWQALRSGDTQTLRTLALGVLPMGQAWAAAEKVPEAKIAASEIEAVVTGTKTLSQIGLDITGLFNVRPGTTGCFGPTVKYANHDDWTPSSGSLATDQLPSGDLGMWTETGTDTTTNPASTQPCAVVELNSQLAPIKRQGRQAMLMMAAMRRAIATSSTLSMPTAGTTTDVTSTLSSTITGVATGTTVSAATLSLNSGGTVYTYRLVLARGTGATAESAEIVIKHTPGASATQFTGVMSITVSQLTSITEASFGCSDQTTTVGSTSYFKTAAVTTVRYSRNGTAIKFGARASSYCGAPSSSSTSHLADVASVDSNGELDPSVHLSGSSTRGSTLGWRGNFNRFAGDFNKETQAGDFIYVWQAGNLDGNGRGFAVHADYNSSTDTRTINAYFAYTPDIKGSTSSTSDMLGLICSWAGPGGGNHTPTSYFQSQTVTLAPSATAWALGTSKIAYAPTTSCNSSSSMTYDVNADQTISTGEGSSVTNALDTKGSSATVEAAIEARGYVKPTFF